MSAEEFNAQLGLCQFLPGPNVINLAVVVGKRYQGLRGAIVAPVGLLAGPLVLVIQLAAQMNDGVIPDGLQVIGMH